MVMEMKTPEALLPLTFIQKASAGWVWWLTLIIPATQEAEILRE
jgi:hypothetical protein